MVPPGSQDRDWTRVVARHVAGEPFSLVKMNELFRALWDSPINQEDPAPEQALAEDDRPSWYDFISSE